MNLDESHHSDVEVDVEDLDSPVDDKGNISLLFQHDKQAVSTMTEEKAMLDAVDSASRQVIEKMLKEEKMYAHGKSIHRTPAPKLARNPLQTNGRWTKEETSLYESGVEIFGEGAWKEIADLVQTKSVNQVRNYARRLKSLQYLEIFIVRSQREAARNITIVEPETPIVQPLDVHRTAQPTVPVRDRVKNPGRGQRLVVSLFDARNGVQDRTRTAGSSRSSDEEDVVVDDDDDDWPAERNVSNSKAVVERNTDNSNVKLCSSEAESATKRKSEALVGDRTLTKVKIEKETKESVVEKKSQLVQLVETDTKPKVETKSNSSFPERVGNSSCGRVVTKSVTVDGIYYVTNASNVNPEDVRYMESVISSIGSGSSSNTSSSNTSSSSSSGSSSSSSSSSSSRSSIGSGRSSNSSSSGQSIISGRATGASISLKWGSSALPVVLDGSQNGVDPSRCRFSGGFMFRIPPASGTVKSSTDIGADNIMSVGKKKLRPIRMKLPDSVPTGDINVPVDEVGRSEGKRTSAKVKSSKTNAVVGPNAGDPLVTIERKTEDGNSSEDDVKRRKKGRTVNVTSGTGRAGMGSDFSPVASKKAIPGQLRPVITRVVSESRTVRAPIFVPPAVEVTDPSETNHEVVVHSSPSGSFSRRLGRDGSCPEMPDEETSNLFMEVDMEEENVHENSPTHSNASASHGTDVVRKVRAPVVLIPSGIPTPISERKSIKNIDRSYHSADVDNVMYYSIKEEVLEGEDHAPQDEKCAEVENSSMGAFPVSIDCIKTELLDHDHSYDDHRKQRSSVSRSEFTSTDSDVDSEQTNPRNESKSLREILRDDTNVVDGARPSVGDVMVSQTSMIAGDVDKKVTAPIFVPPTVDGRRVPNQRLRMSRTTERLATCDDHGQVATSRTDENVTENKKKKVIMVTRACVETSPTIYVYGGSRPTQSDNDDDNDDRRTTSSDSSNNYCVVEMDAMAGSVEPVNDAASNRFYHDWGGYVLAPLDAYRRVREENESKERRTALEESMAAAEETMFSPYMDRATFLSVKKFILLQWQRRSPAYLPADESCRDFSIAARLVKRVHEYLERVGLINRGCVEVDLTKPIGFLPIAVGAAKRRNTPERDEAAQELPGIVVERSETLADDAAVDRLCESAGGADGGQSEPRDAATHVPIVGKSLEESSEKLASDAIPDSGRDEDTDPGDRFYLRDGVGYLTLRVPESERSLDESSMEEDEREAFDMFREERVLANRTPSDYLKIRNHMVDLWKRTRPSYLTKVRARGALKYDVKIVGKIHAFLEKTGVINFGCLEVQYNKSIGWPVDPARSRKSCTEPTKVITSSNYAIIPARKRKVKHGCGHWRSAEEGGECPECGVKQSGVKTPKKRRKGCSGKTHYDPFALVECRAFGSASRAPFRVELTSSSLATVATHALLCRVEVIGLLGGRYRRGEETLSVEVAEPCESLSTEMQCEMDPVSQTLAIDAIQNAGLCVVGWYHSHPTFPPNPSVRDLETQQYMQEYFACSGSPFIGVITQPYNVHDPVTRCLTVRPGQPGQTHGTPYRFDYTLADEETMPSQLLRSKLHRLVEKAVTHPRRVQMMDDSNASLLTRLESHLTSQLRDGYEDAAKICESVLTLIRRSFASPSSNGSTNDDDIDDDDDEGDDEVAGEGGRGSEEVPSGGTNAFPSEDSRYKSDDWAHSCD